jgi:hypothetical protein
MKTLTTNCLIALAALVAAAGSASAQVYKADIPMAFRAGNTVMEPGAYDFNIAANLAGHSYISVRNHASGSTVMLLPIAGSDAPKAWRKAGNPLVSFVCAGRSCSLHEFWNGSDVGTYVFPAHKLPASEAERLAVITVELTKAD